MNLPDRITLNPKQCGGRPCIRGMRIRVRDVLDLLAAGVSEAEILAEYPDLEVEDIRACLKYAAAHVSVGTCRSPNLEKSSPKRLINCWPGDLLREEFMKPLGLSAATIAAALPRRVYPKGPVLTPAYWESRIKVLIGEEDDFEVGPDPFLFAALERYFRLSSGYFLRVWCEAANRAVSKTHARVLERIKPINSTKTGLRTVGRGALPPARLKRLQDGGRIPRQRGREQDEDRLPE